MPTCSDIKFNVLPFPAVNIASKQLQTCLISLPRHRGSVVNHWAYGKQPVNFLSGAGAKGLQIPYRAHEGEEDGKNHQI
ncbi:MAG: hypothetical protein U1E15_09330 [Hyphomicrobiales bacterium]